MHGVPRPALAARGHLLRTQLVPPLSCPCLPAWRRHGHPNLSQLPTGFELNEEAAEKTLGEVYWKAFAAADSTYKGPRSLFGELLPDVRVAIEAGAQAVANAAIQRRIDELDAQAEPVRYALVEQMGHRSTIASIRETTFCGKPMLEVTSLKDGSVHVVAPESLYEVTWLTESDARARAKPWTAVALPAADRFGADEEDDEDGCACYHGPDAHEHDSDEDGDCRKCGCGQYREPIGAGR